MSLKKNIILSGRSSLLARVQISHVAYFLNKSWPSQKLSFYCRVSQGDKDLKKPLWEFSEKGAFSSEFSQILLEKKSDIVIHSYKDLSIEENEKTKIIPILRREDQRDILLCKKSTLEKRPKKLIILSSSLRRIYLLEKFLPHALPSYLQKSKLEFKNIRGNVPTRMERLLESEADIIVNSYAGLLRLLAKEEQMLFRNDLITKKEYIASQKKLRSILNHYKFMLLPLSHFPNAPAQASLVAEIRKADKDIKNILEPLCDPTNIFTSNEERKILGRYGGGCHQKIGATILRKKVGTFKFLQGVDTKGKEFYKKEFVPKKKQAFLPSQQKAYWPRRNEDFLVKREPCLIKEKEEPCFVWVSRAEAWPKSWNYQKKLVWASGPRTMFYLASLGVWVNGCSDFMGEKEDPNINVYLGKEINFTKLTHQRSQVKSRWKTCITYHLHFPQPLPDIRHYKYFFWKSSSVYQAFCQAYPEIKEASHSCSPGLTYDFLQSQDLKYLSVYLNYEAWLKEME